MLVNLPTLLTWMRIIVIPLFLGVYYLPTDWTLYLYRDEIGATLFLLAGITDWFDGYLARKWNQASAFGAFLDPVADKLMVAAALILLVQLGRADAWLAVIIIGREITISALREWMAQVGAAKSIAVSFIGKIKTTMQMVAIFLLLLHQNILLSDMLGINLQQIGSICLIVAALLTLWSMGYYLYIALPQLLKR